MRIFTKDHYTLEEWLQLVESEPIHELTQHITMSKTKSLQHVTARDYIVGCIDTHGRWNFSCAPTYHNTESEAKREAESWARKNPDNAYVYVKIAGAMMINQITEF